MDKKKILLCSLGIAIASIVSIAIAAMFQGFVFALFYNVIYGLILSLGLPVYIMLKNREGVSSVGIKQIGLRQVIVMVVFVFLSVGGQLIPKLIAGESIPWALLPICIAPLIMTTFFEEFLFRGFIQTRVEKQFGSIVAIITSGLLFSLYHLGYPGFRTVEDLLLLFAVGLGFALAYQLSGNNLFVAYFVNLPNAFITYLLKSEQFPLFNGQSTMYAMVTIVAIGVILAFFINRTKRGLHAK